MNNIEFSKNSFSWSLAANLVQNFVQMGCDSYWTFLSLLDYPNDNDYFILILGIVTPIFTIFVVLFEATKIKNEALKIPVMLHSIRKSKTEVELYKMVRKESYFE